MVFHKNLLCVALILFMESAGVTMPVGTLVLAGRAARSAAVLPAGMKMAPIHRSALLLGVYHYSSLKEGYDDLKNTGTQLFVKSKESAGGWYEKLRSKFLQQASSGHVEFVDKKVEQNVGVNNAWIGGQGGSVHHTHIQNQVNYYGKKPNMEIFLEWIEKGKRTRAVGLGAALGVLVGVFGTSCVNFMI